MPLKFYGKIRDMRNKYYNGNNNELLNRSPVIKNNDLNGTSGWANCFLLRDHNAYRGRAVNAEGEL